MKISKLIIFLTACMACVVIYLLRGSYNEAQNTAASNLNGGTPSERASSLRGGSGQGATHNNSAKRKQVQTDDALRYVDFELDPFPIVKSSAHHGWTGIEGVSLEDIEKLAHNDLEKERLLKENNWIVRRELVYRKETIQDVLKDGLANDVTPKEMILPGLDGQEYKVIIDSIEIDNASLGDAATDSSVAAGIVTGHIEGQPNSEMMLGFEEGYEGGFIRGDGVDLTFDTRDSGQFSVTVTDPEKLRAFIQETYPNGAGSSTNDQSQVGEVQP